MERLVFYNTYLRFCWVLGGNEQLHFSVLAFRNCYRGLRLQIKVLLQKRVITDNIPDHYIRLPIAVKGPIQKLIVESPLTPKSDQHQISPCNINALKNRVVMRIKDMITQDEFA